MKKEDYRPPGANGKLCWAGNSVHGQDIAVVCSDPMRLAIVAPIFDQLGDAARLRSHICLASNNDDSQKCKEAVKGLTYISPLNNSLPDISHPG